MEEIPAPEDVSWPEGEGPGAPARLPGFTFLAWLAAIAAVAVLHLVRAAGGWARAAGLPWLGAALEALAVVGAVAAAVAAVVVVWRRRA